VLFFYTIGSRSVLGGILAVGSVENGIHSPFVELHFSERLAAHTMRQRQLGG
jgi:hypothetical protein